MSGFQKTGAGRRSIRLKDWDYTTPGAYFVTLVARGRECLFADIVSGQPRLTAIGQIVQKEWFETAHLRCNVRLYPDEFIVMPNHIHGIIWIVDPVDSVGAQRRCAPTTTTIPTTHVGDENDIPAIVLRTSIHSDPIVKAQRRCAPTTSPTPAKGSLGAILRAYKSAVTRRANLLAGTSLPVWQRNYYEHIIRSQPELDAIRAYIRGNPDRWELDTENVSQAEYQGRQGKREVGDKDRFI